MNWEVLHTFVYNGYVYTSMYDHDSDEVWAYVAAPGSAIAWTVPYSVLTYAENYIFYNICRGTTFVQVHLSNVYPYLRVTKEENNATCIPVDQCNISIADVNVVNESYEGYNDAIITVNINSSSCIPEQRRFSLDGINWQKDNVFTGLLPGNYVAYAKCDLINSCSTFKEFTVVAGAPKPDDIYPYRERFCKWFKLIINNTETEIAEPIKWDAVNIVGTRDKEWHGFNYIYSDGIIELEFDCDAGKELIETEYNTNGSDGEILFQYGYTYNGNDFILFPGKLNLNTYRLLADRVSVSVEKEDFNAVFVSRFGTKVALNSTTTHDGAPILPPDSFPVNFHHKEIIRNYRVNNATESNHKFNYIHPYPYSFSIVLHTIGAQFNEIEENAPYALQTRRDSEPLWEDDLYNWKLTYNGFFNLEASFELDIQFDNMAGRWYRIRTMLRINENEWELAVKTGTAVSRQPVNVKTGPHKFWTDLKAGDKIYLYVQVICEIPITGGSIKQKSINISADFLERSSNSNARCWWLYDSIDYVIRNITNRQAKLKSSILSLKGTSQASDGATSLYVVTNGRQLRGFEVDKSPLVISLKEQLTSIKAQWCLGYGFEKKGNQQYVVVERVNHFYRNREIIVIEDCFDYKEEAADDLLYNEYEFGYAKYQDDGYNTLDEVNTKLEALSPIKKNKLKLSQLSEFITSGYAIETIRRKQFSVGHADSSPFDDDAFLIAMRTNGPNYEVEKSDAFETVENVISPGTSYNLRLAPPRSLRNWGVWLAGTLHYKGNDEKIKITDYKRNGDARTQFKANEPNPLGDLNKRLFSGKDDYTLEHLREDNPERIFRPEWIHFKARITPDKVQLVNESLVGGRTDKTNYGFITVKDFKGNYQAGFPYNIEYNYHSEIMTCKMLKKWDSPVTPNDPCCKYLVVNGCNLIVNGIKLIVK